MPLTLEKTETVDSPELAEFKKKVIEVTNRYTASHGHEEAAREAMAKLGLVDPDRMTVYADTTIKVRTELVIRYDEVKDMTEEQINQYVAEKINGSMRWNNREFIQFRNGVYMRIDGQEHATHEITVTDVNLPSDL